MEGKGKCFLEEGIYYIGEFSNDKMHGKGVMYNKNDNIIYDGEFAIGQREGKGKFISENGYYYIGQWLNDKQHGKGALYNDKDIMLYDGD